MVEELIEKFGSLTEEEKIRFFKAVMPDFKDIICKDPDIIMREMMPECREMMDRCGMDTNQMMEMMGKREKN